MTLKSGSSPSRKLPSFLCVWLNAKPFVQHLCTNDQRNRVAHTDPYINFAPYFLEDF